MLQEILLKPGYLINKDEDPALHDYLASQNSLLLKKISSQIYSLKGSKSREIGLDEKTASNLRIEKAPSDQFIGAHAISMTGLGNKTDLTSLSFVKDKKKDFLICAKTDGVRYILYLMSNGRVFFTDRKCQFFELDFFFPPYFYSYDEKVSPELNFKIMYAFDGELIDFDKSKNKAGDDKEPETELHFLAFDTLMHKGEPTADKTYKQRLNYIKEFENNNRFYSDFFPDSYKRFQELKRVNVTSNIPELKFFLKDFYSTKQIDFLFKKIIHKEILPHENDGLIFTRNSYPYLPGKNRGILKWKPQKLKTIDFFVCENQRYIKDYQELAENDDFFVFELYAISKGSLKLIDFLFISDVEQYILISGKIQTHTINEKEYQGCIYECNYDENLEIEKMEYFFDIYYESDMESIVKMIEWSIYGAADAEDEYVIQALMKNLESRLANSNGVPRGGWKLMRDRNDKNYPNAYGTALNIYTSILEFNMDEDELIDEFKPVKKNKR